MTVRIHVTACGRQIAIWFPLGKILNLGRKVALLKHGLETWGMEKILLTQSYSHLFMYIIVANGCMLDTLAKELLMFKELKCIGGHRRKKGYALSLLLYKDDY